VLLHRALSLSKKAIGLFRQRVYMQACSPQSCMQNVTAAAHVRLRDVFWIFLPPRRQNSAGLFLRIGFFDSQSARCLHRAL
jgi:hypothetical protein